MHSSLSSQSLDFVHVGVVHVWLQHICPVWHVWPPHVRGSFLQNDSHVPWLMQVSVVSGFWSLHSVSL